MHNVDIDIVDMALDVMKFAINRITDSDPVLGFPKKEEELRALVGETITPEGIGGEKAFQLFRDVLLKSSISIDHRRHLAFVPASPTRAAVMFDLVTSASSIHGAYWLEGAGGIFAENQAMAWIVSLTGMPPGTFGVFTSGGTAANLSALVTAREYWRSRDKANQAKRGLIIASDGAHSSIRSMAKVIDADVLLVEMKAGSKARRSQKLSKIYRLSTMNASLRSLGLAAPQTQVLSMTSPVSLTSAILKNSGSMLTQHTAAEHWRRRPSGTCLTASNVPTASRSTRTNGCFRLMIVVLLSTVNRSLPTTSTPRRVHTLTPLRRRGRGALTRLIIKFN